MTEALAIELAAAIVKHLRREQSLADEKQPSETEDHPSPKGDDR